MIGKHCGKPLHTISDNPFYFRKRCSVCGKVFKQAKRLSEERKAKRARR